MRARPQNARRKGFATSLMGMTRSLRSVYTRVMGQRRPCSTSLLPTQRQPPQRPPSPEKGPAFTRVSRSHREGRLLGLRLKPRQLAWLPLKPSVIAIRFGDYATHLHGCRSSSRNIFPIRLRPFCGMFGRGSWNWQRQPSLRKKCDPEKQGL